MNSFKIVIIAQVLFFGLLYFWIGVQVYDEYSTPSVYVEDSQTNLFIPDDCNSTIPIEQIPVSNKSLLRTVNFDQINYITYGDTICTESQTLPLLVVIVSDPRNEQTRRNLRKTWTTVLAHKNDSRVVYFMGMSKDNRTNDAVIEEEAVYKDMVIVDFDDRYRNLTLKIVLMLNWVRNYCPSARFVLKCDDDMFVNSYNLMNFVRNHNPDKRSFYGRLLQKSLPIRSTNSPFLKWLVTEEEYPDSEYPDYVTGPAYLFGTEGISDLFEVSLKLPYFYLEDVFVTGLCARVVNYCRRKHSLFVNDEIARKKCSVLSVISVHHVSGSRLRLLWKRIINPELYKYCQIKKPDNL